MGIKIRKELREWVVLLTVGGFIYFMGWHTVIIGKIQQAVLYSGLITPSELTEEKFASYNFTLESMDGEKVLFSEFLGKTVFVNFWATWCPPCIAEMPDIHDLYEEKGDEVLFVMISLDENKGKARAFIEKRGFEFPVYFLASGLPSTYQVHSIPTTYLIDKEGTIRVENSGMAKYNTNDFKKLLEEIR
ncbi:MAG: TlpA disulfide reductase family protein [Cyclobacteriaceae bacterium]